MVWAVGPGPGVAPCGGQHSHPPAPAPSNQTPHSTCPHPPWQRWEAEPPSQHPAASSQHPAASSQPPSAPRCWGTCWLPALPWAPPAARPELCRMRWLQAARTAGDLGGDLTPASGSARAVAVCYSPAAAQETCGGSAPRELIPLRRSPVRCRWWRGDRRAAPPAPSPSPSPSRGWEQRVGAAPPGTSA